MEAMANEITNETTDEESAPESGEVKKHASLLEPNHLASLFGDAMVKNLLKRKSFNSAIRCAKGWLNQLVMYELEAERENLQKQIRSLYWNLQAHETLCTHLLDEANACGTCPERITKIQKMLNRAHRLTERLKVASPEAPGASDRAWLNQERISVMVRMSNCLGDTGSILHERIRRAFQSDDPTRYDALIQHLNDVCEARRRLMDMLAAPEPVPPAPRKKEKSLRTSPPHSCKTGAERFQARHGQSSTTTAPEGAVLH